MATNDHRKQETDKRLKDLRKYFDEVAWKQQEEGKWTDTELEVSPTRINDWYAYREHARNRNYLKGKGLYFLDAGCGARPYSIYASGYRHHVCVDFSITGLKGARQCFKERAYYVQADIRYLPFKMDTFEGLCSPYAIHHIAGTENQKTAFNELHRVLQAGCSGVVIYDNPNHLGIKLRRWISRAPWLKSLISGLARKSVKDSHPGEHSPIKEALKAREELLHYEPLPGPVISQFISREKAISIKIHSLLTEPAKKSWLRDNLLWNIILRLLLLLESLAGGFLPPLAAVWCVVIRKKG